MWNILWTVISKSWPRFISWIIDLLESVTFQLLQRMLSSFSAETKSYVLRSVLVD